MAQFRAGDSHVGMLGYPALEGARRGLKAIAVAGSIAPVDCAQPHRFLWAPVQAAMATHDGMSAALYHELMATHWFRVLFFLVYAGLMVWLIVRSLPTIPAAKPPAFSNEAA